LCKLKIRMGLDEAMTLEIVYGVLRSNCHEKTLVQNTAKHLKNSKAFKV